jgi:hypothetical protein
MQDVYETPFDRYETPYEASERSVAELDARLDPVGSSVARIDATLAELETSMARLERTLRWYTIISLICMIMVAAMLVDVVVLGR